VSNWVASCVDGALVVFEGDRGYDSWVPTPMLGEQNHEVVVGLGLASEDEYAALVASGMLADRPPA